MREVRMYVSEDGTLFRTRNEAEKRDRLTELKEWYEENKIYGDTVGCRIEWVDFLDWMQENGKEAIRIARLLGAKASS